MSSGLTITLLASILLHLLGFTALPMVGGSLWSPSPPSIVISTDLLVEPPLPVVSEPVSPPEPEPLPAPPPEPEPQPVTPPKVEEVIPPKLVEKPMPERAPSPLKPAPLVSRARLHEPASLPPQIPQSAPPGSPLPLPAEARAATGGNVLGPPVERPPDAAPPPPMEGGEAGAGKLFDKGDVGVVSGSGAGGGSGGPGRVGLGTGEAGASGGTRVAGLPPGVGLGGDSGAARPLGGYQVKPRYPESARRQGFEGTTLLKIYVSGTGRVEDVLVKRSVAVWFMLPVRFALK